MMFRTAQSCMLRKKAMATASSTSDVPSIKLRQIFVNDPNGVTLELNFR